MAYALTYADLKHMLYPMLEQIYLGVNDGTSRKNIQKWP